MKGRPLPPAVEEHAVADGEGLVAKHAIPDLLQAEYEAASQSIESGLCGHALSEHKSVKLPKRPAFIVPPACERCKCKSFCYSPLFPEECGQWWLRRRRDFNILDWRKRVRQLPEEYACVGCNLKLSDHECLFESRTDRLARGAAVDQAYLPLSTAK